MLAKGIELLGADVELTGAGGGAGGAEGGAAVVEADGAKLRDDQRPDPPGVSRFACAEAADSRASGAGLADLPWRLVPYPADKAAAEAVNVLLTSLFQVVGNGGGAGGSGGGGGGCLLGGCFGDGSSVPLLCSDS